MASEVTAGTGDRRRDDRYKWAALANTTAAVFMSQLDGSIVIIALPAISAASTWIHWRRATSATCCG